MAIKTRYKVIVVPAGKLEEQLNTLAKTGWRPVTMTTQSVATMVVILEKKTS